MNTYQIKFDKLLSKNSYFFNNLIFNSLRNFRIIANKIFYVINLSHFNLINIFHNLFKLQRSNRPVTRRLQSLHSPQD